MRKPAHTQHTTIHPSARNSIQYTLQHTILPTLQHILQHKLQRTRYHTLKHTLQHPLALLFGGEVAQVLMSMWISFIPRTTPESEIKTDVKVWCSACWSVWCSACTATVVLPAQNSAQQRYGVLQCTLQCVLQCVRINCWVLLDDSHQTLNDARVCRSACCIVCCSVCGRVCCIVWCSVFAVCVAECVAGVLYVVHCNTQCVSSC